MGGLSCMAIEFGGRDDMTPFVGFKYAIDFFCCNLANDGMIDCGLGRTQVNVRLARRCWVGLIPVRLSILSLSTVLLSLPIFLAYKVRIGAGFYGSINNLIVSSGAMVSLISLNCEFNICKHVRLH